MPSGRVDTTSIRAHQQGIHGDGEKLNEEIMAESWQVTCGQNEPENGDDDGLAEEEAHLERVSNLNDITDSTIRKGILNGTIPSAAYDTAATSSCRKYGDPFIPTGRQSTKVFQTPTGHKSPASKIRLLDGTNGNYAS